MIRLLDNDFEIIKKNKYFRVMLFFAFLGLMCNNANALILAPGYDNLSLPEIVYLSDSIIHGKVKSKWFDPPNINHVRTFYEIELLEVIYNSSESTYIMNNHSNVVIEFFGGFTEEYKIYIPGDQRQL